MPRVSIYILIITYLNELVQSFLIRNKFNINCVLEKISTLSEDKYYVNCQYIPKCGINLEKRKSNGLNTTLCFIVIQEISFLLEHHLEFVSVIYLLHCLYVDVLSELALMLLLLQGVAYPKSLLKIHWQHGQLIRALRKALLYLGQ